MKFLVVKGSNVWEAVKGTRKGPRNRKCVNLTFRDLILCQSQPTFTFETSWLMMLGNQELS